MYTCVCGSSTGSFVFNNQFIICARCKTIRRRVMPTDAELKEIYSNSYSAVSISSDSTNQTSPSQIVDNYARFIASELYTGLPHLDIGAGLGALVVRLKELGIVSDGVEASDEARQAAWINYNLKLKGSLADATSTYGSFSLIEVIEHFQDPVMYLRQLHKHMPNASKLIITTPNVRSLSSIISGSNWNEIKDKPFHLVMFSKLGLKLMLESIGFHNLKFMPNYQLSTGYYGRLKSFLLFKMGLNGSHCLTVEK